MKAQSRNFDQPPVQPPGDTNDLLYEATTHVFVVKLWQQAGDQGAPTTWRGQITHIPSEEQHYLQGLGDVMAFIKQFMKE